MSARPDEAGSAINEQGRCRGVNNADEFYLERYKYILHQLHSANENVYRFLAIYQTLATTLVGAGLAIFVGYRKWGIDPGLAKTGVLGFLGLATVVAAFAILLVVVGVATWFDYRREECELTDSVVRSGFRSPPNLKNLFRWYETYIVLFIFSTILAAWVLVWRYLLPAIE